MAKGRELTMKYSFWNFRPTIAKPVQVLPMHKCTFIRSYGDLQNEICHENRFGTVFELTHQTSNLYIYEQYSRRIVYVHNIFRAVARAYI